MSLPKCGNSWTLMPFGPIIARALSDDYTEKTFMRLQDKVAIVTGASRGIGEAIAVGYAREGAHLILAARSEEDLERVAGLVRAESREALAVVTDVTDEESVRQMIDAGIAKFGRIDILVNNAGGGM